MKREQRTPTTLLVQEELETCPEEVLDTDTLVARTGRTKSQVSAACFHLRQHSVIDVIVDINKLWWFKINGDDRQRIITKIAADITKRPHTKKKRRKRVSDGTVS